jgi:hypothetical protein
MGEMPQLVRLSMGRLPLDLDHVPSSIRMLEANVATEWRV